MKACCLTDFTSRFSRELEMCELVKINECQFNESQKVEKIDQTKKTKNEEKWQNSKSEGKGVKWQNTKRK